MVSFFLNFPMFYHCAIKDHTSLSQYDAVSILLLGKSKADCRRKTISDYRAVYYTLGMERLPSDILTSLLHCSREELLRRFRLLQLQESDSISCALGHLIRHVENIGRTKRVILETKINNGYDFYEIILDIFLLALKCPPEHILPLTQRDRDFIQHCWEASSAAKALSSDKLPDSPAAVSGEAPADIPEESPEENPEESAAGPSETAPASSPFAEDMLTVKYRKVTIPDELEEIADYFLHISEPGMMSLDWADIMSVLTDDTGMATFGFAFVCGKLEEVEDFLVHSHLWKNCTSMISYCNIGTLVDWSHMGLAETVFRKRCGSAFHITSTWSRLRDDDRLELWMLYKILPLEQHRLAETDNNSYADRASKYIDLMSFQR